MNKRPAALSVCLAVISTLIFAPEKSQADPGTNAPTQSVPADAPPVPTVPSETPQPAQPSAPSAAPTPAPDMSTERPTEYTVASGDTLWAISHKFDTSIRALKKLNHLKKTNLKPGQVLKIPAAKEPAKKTTVVSHKAGMVVSATSRHALASPKLVLFTSRTGLPDASVPSGPMSIAFADTSVSVPVREPLAVPATVSDTLGRATAMATQPEGGTPELTSSTRAPRPTLAQSQSSKNRVVVSSTTASVSPDLSAPTMTYTMPAPSPANHGLFNFFYTPPPSADWSTRFTQVARSLGERGLDYADDWRPPGEAHTWTMDCSNTSRYIYRVTTGIQLPRTASDQYYYLHLQRKAWDVPASTSGVAEINYLHRNLKAGDLLFWENTYKPERQPPITHVMVYLGTNDRGQLMMAGSQSTGGGEHKRHHGGPDIYVFNPTRACGGYSTWLGLVHHQGRFCAFGRPLEADKAKLAMAAND